MTRISSFIRFLLIMLFAPGLALAQQFVPPPQLAVKRGSEIFVQTCTQSYCHGANGAVGGAPRLAGRGFNAEYIEKVVTYGIPGTPMPAWGQMISQLDLRAVIAYVASLNGISPTGLPVPASVLAGNEAHGRDLFFDATQPARCSNCHRITEKGIPVTPPVANIPEDSRALRSMKTSQVVNATAGGQVFPAVVSAQVLDEIKLYDLTVFPPVLRTFSRSEVTIKQGSDWNHSSVLGDYSDTELESILAFLRVTKAP